MKKAHTFQLETAIAAWRHSLQHERFIHADDLDELEQHVRDQVAHLIEQGSSEEEAFQAAMETMGSQDETQAAYRKAYWGKLKQKRRLNEELQWRASMIKNYIKVAVRHLRKQKGYATINILGLAIGLTCFILIGLFVRFELSYDQFHEKADRTYRIAKRMPGKEFLGSDGWTATPAPLVKAMMEELPQVEHATQFAKVNSLIDLDGKRFYEDGLFSTKHFFDVFSFRLLQGDPTSALEDPNSIVLTESLAKKYFGEQNPMGQSVLVSHSGENYSGELGLVVTGVVADPPANSHFTFDFLVPVVTSGDLVNYLDRWDSNSYYTYVSLTPGHSISTFTTNLRTMAKTHLSQVPFYQENPDAAGIYFPQALTDIHLRSKVNMEFQVNGDIRFVYLFSAIGILILIIACINYINLATARSATRSMEVGVRKVMGARRGQLIGQFMSEAVLPSVLALFIAAFLVVLLLPTFNALTAREMVLDFSQHGGFIVMLLLVGLGVGILAGSYPALMMSSFHPVSMMKGLLNRNAGKTTLRNTLVVVQFSISIVLVIGTIVIQRQMHYIRNTDTGIERDQIVAISIKDQSMHSDRFATLKRTLESYPNVRGVTAAQTNPTNVDAASRAQEWEGAEPGQNLLVYRSIVQPDYVDLFGLELVEGRDFSETRLSDEREGVLINETLKRQLGWDTAVNKWFNFYGSEFTVIGVVKDFNFHSFHTPVAPIALFIDSSRWFGHQRLFVKAGTGDMVDTIAFLQKTMADFSPEYPFEYEFLDDLYNQMYQTESRLGALLSYFTFLALFVACLGLLGLATFTARQRMKEIGVRKVLGATQQDILVLLSKDFTKLVGIAFLIAAPIGYLAQSQWLQSFAYRIPVGLGTFLLAGGAILLVAWLTVSYQAIRAASMDPVKSIRYE